MNQKLPDYLTVDGSHRCDVCGRKSWRDHDEPVACGMPQPDGSICPGTLGPRGRFGEITRDSLTRMPGAQDAGGQLVAQLRAALQPLLDANGQDAGGFAGHCVWCVAGDGEAHAASCPVTKRDALLGRTTR